mmetsp:Transcript_47219/g.60684  ORF Transcript_47219/g.60684 Transcript_47219/m.60684 type:complete len:157 (+) Transcript_47219:217-687(+)
MNMEVNNKEHKKSNHELCVNMHHWKVGWMKWVNGCKDGKNQTNRYTGRWEATSPLRLIEDEVTLAAFKGFKNGLCHYKFVDYFDTIEEKYVWLKNIKEDFSRRELAAEKHFNTIMEIDTLTIKRNFGVRIALTGRLFDEEDINREAILLSSSLYSK